MSYRVCWWFSIPGCRRADALSWPRRKLPPNRAEHRAVLIRSLPQCQRVTSLSWPNEQKLDKYNTIVVAEIMGIILGIFVARPWK